MLRWREILSKQIFWGEIMPKNSPRTLSKFSTVTNNNVQKISIENQKMHKQHALVLPFIFFWLLSIQAWLDYVT